MEIDEFGLKEVIEKRPNAEQIEICMNWINEFCKPSTRYALSSSYTYKHVVEKWANTYISNGAFIQAAVNLGYKYKQVGPNAVFKMKVSRLDN